MKRKLYDIFNLTSEASNKEIIDTYKRLALQYHPDRSTGNAVKMKDLNMAYKILIKQSETSRYIYDVFGDNIIKYLDDSSIQTIICSILTRFNLFCLSTAIILFMVNLCSYPILLHYYRKKSIKNFIWLGMPTILSLIFIAFFGFFSSMNLTFYYGEEESNLQQITKINMESVYISAIFWCIQLVVFAFLIEKKPTKDLLMNFLPYILLEIYNIYYIICYIRIISPYIKNVETVYINILIPIIRCFLVQYVYRNTSKYRKYFFMLFLMVFSLESWFLNLKILVLVLFSSILTVSKNIWHSNTSKWYNIGYFVLFYILIGFLLIPIEIDNLHYYLLEIIYNI